VKQEPDVLFAYFNPVESEARIVLSATTISSTASLYFTGRTSSWS
jgi:hypothetical protein